MKSAEFASLLISQVAKHDSSVLENMAQFDGCTLASLSILLKTQFNYDCYKTARTARMRKNWEYFVITPEIRITATSDFLNSADAPPICVLGNTVSTPHDERTEDQQAQFAEIVAHLHYSGDKQDVLHEQQKVTLWIMADGYGSMTLNELCELDLMWDWSHVRDSSDYALARIYDRLQRMLVAKDRLAKYLQK